MGDGYDALRSIGGVIKGRLMVTFVSQHGVLEAGIDHGGLVKEFLEEVGSGTMFDSQCSVSMHAVLPGLEGICHSVDRICSERLADSLLHLWLMICCAH